MFINMKTSSGIRLAAALLAAALAYVIGHWFFLDLPFTTDENSYVFQSINFLEGRVARSAPPVRQAFSHPMIICDEQAGWLSRYPPAHSLWLAPGVLAGNPRLMSALAAGLSVWLITACALLLNIPALIIALLLLASPYFLFLHGSLLSHTSGILAVSLMTWACLKWTRSERWGYAALAGLAWSFLFLNRTWTAVLLAVPFGADALLNLARRRNRGALSGTAAFALCAAVGIACFLWYNFLTTGDVLMTTYKYDHLGRFMGFGPGFNAAGQVYYVHTVAMGFRNLLGNVLLLDKWLFGFKGSLLAGLALIAIGWLGRWSVVWLAAIVLICLGHTTFWYRGENHIGPYYYFEMFPFLALMIAMGLTRLWRQAQTRSWFWCGLYLAAAGAALIASAAFMMREGRLIRNAFLPEFEFVRQLRSAPADALVAINPNLPERLDMLVFNPRGLDSQPLVVRPYDDALQALLRCLDGRKGYWLEGDGSRGFKEVHKTPLRKVFDPAYMNRLTGGNERQVDGRVVRAARAGRDAGQALAFGRSCYLYPGRFVFEADLVWSNVLETAPSWMDAASDIGRNVLARRGFHGAGEDCVRMEFCVPAPVLVEPRIYYGGAGDVVVKALRLVELEENTRQ